MKHNDKPTSNPLTIQFPNTCWVLNLCLGLAISGCGKVNVGLESSGSPEKQTDPSPEIQTTTSEVSPIPELPVEPVVETPPTLPENQVVSYESKKPIVVYENPDLEEYMKKNGPAHEGVAKYNRNEISKDEALTIISETLQVIEETTGISKNVQIEKFERTRDLAQLVVDLQSTRSNKEISSILQDLRGVLGRDLFESDAPTEMFSIDDLFTTLTKISRQVDISITNDTFLIQYLIISQNSFNRSNESIVSFGEPVEEYFTNKLKSQHIKAYLLNEAQRVSKKGESDSKLVSWMPKPLMTVFKRAYSKVDAKDFVNSVFSGYAGIEKIIEENEWILKYMGPFAVVADIGTMGRTPQELFAKVLEAQIALKSKTLLSKKLLENSIDHALWGVKQLAATKEGRFIPSGQFNVVVSGIDRMNMMFDQDPKSFKDFSFESWVKLADLRTVGVLRTLKHNLANNPLALERALKNYVPPKHPYTKVYWDRALMESNPKLVNSSHIGIHFTTAQALEESFNQGIRSLQGQLTMSTEISSAGSLKDMNEGESASKYLSLFYAIEGLRFGLETKAIAQKDKTLAIKEANENHAMLARMESLLETALAIRYSEKLLGNLGRPKNPCLKSWNNQIQEHSFYLCNFIRSTEGLEKELRSIESTKLVRYGNLFVEPGIYTESDSLEITADSIEFHPLSMLKVESDDIKKAAPSITITAKRVVDPWLKASGLSFDQSAAPGKSYALGRQSSVSYTYNGNGSPARFAVSDLVDPPKKRKWFSAESVIVEQEKGPDKQWQQLMGFLNRNFYFTDAEKVFIGEYGYNMENFRGSKNAHVVHYNALPFLKDKGEAPPQPKKSLNGQSGGNVNLRITEVDGLSGFMIVTSNGGDGENGVEGSDSPFFENGVYQAPPRAIREVGFKRHGANDFVVNDPTTFQFQLYTPHVGPGRGGVGGDGGAGGQVLVLAPKGQTLARAAVLASLIGGQGSSGGEPGYPRTDPGSSRAASDYDVPLHFSGDYLISGPVGTYRKGKHADSNPVEPYLSVCFREGTQGARVQWSIRYFIEWGQHYADKFHDDTSANSFINIWRSQKDSYVSRFYNILEDQTFLVYGKTRADINTTRQSAACAKARQEYKKVSESFIDDTELFQVPKRADSGVNGNFGSVKFN